MPKQSNIDTEIIAPTQKPMSEILGITIESAINMIEQIAIDNRIELEDLYKLPQNRFNWLLTCLGKQLGYYDGILLDKESYKTVPGMEQRTLIYDYKKLDYLANIYLMLCNVFCKFASIDGFGYMTNIDWMTLKRWRDPNYGNIQAYLIVQKICHDREQHIANSLLDTNNPVGRLAVANQEYAWNMPGVKESMEERKARISASQLPELRLEGQSIVQIDEG